MSTVHDILVTKGSQVLSIGPQASVLDAAHEAAAKATLKWLEEEKRKG